MPYFKKLLQTDFGNRLFYFNRIFTSNGVRYHIAVSDEKKQHIFYMEVKKAKWHIVESPKVPDWVKQLENELSLAIIEHNPIDLI
jgi:hypothetical protein